MQYPYQRIANLLAENIRNSDRAVIQPISALAATHRCSRPTMAKAVRELVNQGVLEVLRGRSIGVCGRSRSTDDLLGASAASLAGSIRAGIADGTYRAGRVLPKSTYFIVTHRIASDTVQQALQALNREGLVYKAGKRWIVGKAPAQRAKSRTARADMPVVLTVFPSIEDCVSMVGAHNLFSQAFSVFETEISRYGISQAPLFIRAALRELGLASGLDRMERLIGSLGSRYRGALVAWLHTGQSVKVFDRFFGDLIRRRQPVVWFDPLQESSRVGLINHLRTVVPLAKKLFYHCSINQQALVDLCVDALLDHGHRRIGIVESFKDHRVQGGWARARIALLQATLLRRGADPVMIGDGDDDPTAGDSPHFPTFDFAAVNKESADRYRSHGPSHTVKRVIAEKVTALIALNDFAAVRIYTRLSAAGISVPSDISLISFDNIPNARVIPLTTIDQGFGSLGYFAAHIFIGHIPVKSDRFHSVSSTPMLLQRGTLARAR